MPDLGPPLSFEIISPDGRGRVKVSYPPLSTAKERRAIRKEARREYFRLYGGGKGSYRVKRHRGRYRISNIFSRHRMELLPSRYPNPKNGTTVTLGYRRDFQGGKQFQKLPITNGGFSAASAYGRECWDNVNPGPPFRTVGPLKLIQYWVPGSEIIPGGSSFGKDTPTNSGNYSVYHGSYIDNGFWISDSFGSYSGAGLSSMPSLTGYDTMAWDALKPTIPAWNATQFIYELKDLPGMLKTTAEAFGFRWRLLAQDRFTYGSKWWEKPDIGFSSVADQFLNEEFGWAPFISDLQKLILAYENGAKYLSDMVRQNRTWMKRHRILEEETTVSAPQRFYSSATIPHDGALDWQNIPMCKPTTIDGILCKGITDFTKIVKKRVWGSGQFMYYRPEFDPMDPDFDSGIMVLRRMLTQYGFRINPSVLYKVTPWSWLVDWFTNFGKHIDRLNDFVEDGIVARNLVICGTEDRTITKTCSIFYYGNPVTVTTQRRLLMKQRKVADSPYGFDSPWNNISLRRWLILGSIGISRLGSGFISRGA